MKEYDRYHMNFDGKSMKASMAAMGIGVFLLFVNFFGWKPLWQVKFLDWIFAFGVPVAVGVTYIVLGRFRQLNAPGIYAILGAVLCLCLLVCSFTTGSAVRIVLSVIWYILCGLTLIGVAGGALPGKLPASLFFGIALAVRVLFFDLTNFFGTNWIREGSALAMLLALTLLPGAFRSSKKI